MKNKKDFEPLKNGMKVSKEIYVSMKDTLLGLSLIQDDKKHSSLEEKLYHKKTEKVDATGFAWIGELFPKDDEETCTSVFLEYKEVLKYDKENNLYFADKEIYNKLYGMQVP